MASTHDLRAKDLVRSREIAERAWLGEGTIDRLVSRKWRRPAGCTARLYKALSTDDPFQPPPDEVPKKEHRPVSAADRFARIDNAAGKVTTKSAFQAPSSNKTPYWVEELARLKSQSTRAQAEKVQQERVRGRKNKLPDQVHTPAFGGQVDDPTLDRTPPRIVPEESSSGRMRARPRRAPRPEPVASDDVDRTPPKIEPGEAPSKPAHKARPKRKVALGPDGKPVDRRPPKLDFVPTDRNGEPIRPWRERRKERGGVLGGDSSEDGHLAPAQPPPKPRPTPPPKQTTPPVAQPPESSNEAAPAEPPRRLPSAGAGLDDLFGGGPQEGRARIGRRQKKTVGAIPEEAAPQDTIDRTPPKIDRTPPKIATASQQPERAPVPEPSPPDDAAPSEQIPPAPPRRLAGSGGLDDLFGGAQEGRARIGKRKRKTVAAIPEPEAPREAIDRTPPKIDRTPPMIDRTPPTVAAGPSTPEPQPAPAEAADPEQQAPAPRRLAGSGGLDDLFGGGPPDGRARIGKRNKKTVAAIPEPEAPKEAIDRTPPKIDRTPPKIDRTPPMIAAATPAPEPDPAPVAAPPPADDADLDDLLAPPPPRRLPGSGGLDDLFGGMTQGRARIGKRKKKTVAAIPDEPAPVADSVDRTPPRIDDVDPSKLTK